MIEKIDLCGKWSVTDSLGESFVGNVPGCIHTDLFTKDEMFYEKNSEKVRFIEERDYTYRKEFSVVGLRENPVLYFEGLDTYSDVYLNGVKLGSTDNMFIPHSFPVQGILKEGKNTVEVRFYSPVKAVEGRPPLIGCFTTERLYTRRMQCTYGWDWVDRFVTTGIYRPAYILYENEMALRDVYVFTEGVDKYSARVKVVEHFKNCSEGALVKTEIIDPHGKTVWERDSWCIEDENVFHADIRDPELWYPHNYGDQPIYTLKITVGDNVSYQKFGIRTVKILELEDTDPETLAMCEFLKSTASGRYYDHNEKTSCFILLVNGVRIFCTGANWVPCEPFPSAESEEKITKLLESSVDAGVNMIRVWGGGIFEKSHFYDECDRLGILVTQDFLMACGRYPESDPDFKEHLRREAEFAAVYLRNHPSLVWWSGDNENAVNGDDTMESYPGRISARSVIAPVLEKLDYNRVFLFSSPYGGKRYASKTVGTTHNTQFMGYFFDFVFKDDITDYREWWRDTTARFIAEEPNMGAVCPASLREFISDENIESRDMWLYHTKTNNGLKRELMDIAAEFAFKLFGMPTDFEDQYFKMRYVQYEWVRISLGNARSNAWFNSGIIYWMLNDCWPAAVGWSLLDYYTRPKSGFYAMKKFSGRENVYITRSDSGYLVNVSNIMEHDAELDLEIGVLNTVSNEYRQLVCERISVPSGCLAYPIDFSLADGEMLIAEINNGDSLQRSQYKNSLPYLHKTDDIHWQIEEGTITVWSDKYIHAVEIECGDIIEDNYFSLLPGERRTVNIGNSEIKTVRAFTV